MLAVGVFEEDTVSDTSETVLIETYSDEENVMSSSMDDSLTQV